MKKYLGIDIGGTAVKIGAISSNGVVFEKSEYSVSFDNYETPIIESVKKGVYRFFEQYTYCENDFSGIGVSATGQIDVHSGTVIGVGGNIKNWLNTNIKSILEEEFKLPVTVLNDANCMVIGEKWTGSAKGKDNVIGITIGTGVGGGIIVDGKILTGTLGIAGEIGHMIINFDGDQCSCGNRGCYERYASMSRLVKNVKESIIENNLDYEVSLINGRYIFSLAEAGDNFMQLKIDEWLKAIAAGAISLIHTFNPDTVIFGGGVSAQKDMFLEPLRKLIQEGAMVNFAKSVEIKAASLANDAGMVGAVAYCIQLESKKD